MTIEGGITGSNNANLDDEVRLTGMDLTLAMSEWTKAKETALANKQPFTEIRPNSRAYLDMKGTELATQREKAFQKEQEKLEAQRKKNPEFFEKISLRPEERQDLGTVDIKEEKKKSKIWKTLLKDKVMVATLKEKLRSVYDHTPNPMNFIGISEETENEDFYSEQTILNDIQHVKEVRSFIDSEDAKYGESLKKRREAGFDQSEIFQIMIIDQINKGWVPEMIGSRTYDFDDLEGSDAVFQYKKKSYFAASFDMTINQEKEAIENKLQKNWERYIVTGILPRVKYYEDPENSKNRGKRIMPKFIIGGSNEDLEQLTDAYLNNDLESVAEYPLKYTIISQIEIQLDKILDFYFSPENIDNPKFDFARKQYTRFEDFFEEIKNSVDYYNKMDTDEISEHRENNAIYKVCKSFVPKIDSRLAA